MKLNGLVVSVAAAILAGIAFAYVRQTEPPQKFCQLAATIPSGEPVEIEGQTFWIDGGLPPHNEECGPSYMMSDLNQVDGVIYSNCRILWTTGGATSAEPAGIPCPTSE